MVTSKDLAAHEVAVEVDLCNGDNLMKLELDLPQKEITKALITMAKSYVKREWLWYGMKSTNRTVCWKILSLPISSVTSLLKSSNSSAYLQLRDSSDPLVSSHWKPTEPMAKLLIAKDKQKSISPSLAAGNWDVRKSVEMAEHSVKLNKKSRFG